jgi:hypothetical protein
LNDGPRDHQAAFHHARQNDRQIRLVGAGFRVTVGDRIIAQRLRGAGAGGQ